MFTSQRGVLLGILKLMCRRSLRLAMVATVLAATVSLAGCSSLLKSSESEIHIPANPSAPADPTEGALATFYQQSPQWQPCEAKEITSEGASAPADISSYECATIKAPLDWNNPGGDTINLRIAIHHSGVKSAPVLFYNLGGPGGAAIESFSSIMGSTLGSDLTKNFDIVAMDPRGVGESTPVICMTDAERDEYNASSGTISSTDPEQIAKHAAEISEKFGKGCLEHSGDLAQHIDTISAAHDFDMARAVLKQDVLNYLGYSYGTFLGATYASQFPLRVGRMVLDGALDPALGADEISNLQMKGFEESLHHWIEDCQTSLSCPLTGGLEGGIQQMKNFLERLDKTPLTTSDPNRPLTQGLALTAIIGCLYSTSSYANLTEGMSQALSKNDGSTLLFLADILNERNTDGTYRSNSTDALMAINSLDYVPEGDVQSWASEAEQLKAELPILGEYAGYSSAGLEAWPIKSTAKRGPITAEGTPPILVIGTTHDPATPYVMAQSLASELSQGHLVTWEGWNHTAYSAQGSACVSKAVNGFFVDGTVPAEGLTCTD